MPRLEKHNAMAWRARAEECRSIGDSFDNPETRRKMYALADDYDQMAEKEERRLKSVGGADSPHQHAQRQSSHDASREAAVNDVGPKAGLPGALVSTEPD